MQGYMQHRKTFSPFTCGETWRHEGWGYKGWFSPSGW